MPDIFDKCVKFRDHSPIIEGEHRQKAEGVLYRRMPLDNAGPWMDVDGRRMLQFSTNDYLGLASDRRVIKAASDIASRYGISAPMGARPLTGNTELHEELERQLADFKRTEKALVFSNGAFAMMGAIAALAGPRDLILLDRYAHASLVCGARISGARMRFFQHNDVEDLEAILMETPANRARMVVVDGVYSMQGDTAPLPDLCDLCEKYGARLIVDDAHGTGVCGANGRGTAELQGVEDRIDLHLGTCSKAMATTGGFVAGDDVVINHLRYNAPTILFTKAMPGAVAAATLEALRIVRTEGDRRTRLWENTRFLQGELKAMGYDIGKTQTPITPIRGNGTDAVHISAELDEEYDIFASAVLYPAVPIGTSILRVIPTASHSREDLRTLLDAMGELRRKYPCSKKPRVPAAS
jgi:8-amino-7-oxononanoate synthase